MQERSRESSMDLKAYLNNLRRNPRYTEDILALVESDLQYGLTIAETEGYTNGKYDYSQMKIYSACLRNGYTEEVRQVIVGEGLSGGQMAVALEFYEKGVPLKVVQEVTTDASQTAFVMKKLFQTVCGRLGEAATVSEQEAIYAKELLEQIQAVVQKIEFQEKRYDALNEKLTELRTAGEDAVIQGNLLTQLGERDSLLEKQQDEINQARVTIARLRNEVEEVRKEKEILEVKVEESKRRSQETVQTGGTQEMKSQPVSDSQQGAYANVKQPQEKTEAKAPIQQQSIPVPVYPTVEYHAALVDAGGRVVSYLPVEHTSRKKETGLLSAIFSRQIFKKKIDIIRLVAEKNLEPKQLMQVRNAIEKGLDEQQMLVLINHQLPAEQMEEIINIAVFENRRKQEA